jgi:hypothetical protein
VQRQRAELGGQPLRALARPGLRAQPVRRPRERLPAGRRAGRQRQRRLDRAGVADGDLQDDPDVRGRELLGRGVGVGAGGVRQVPYRRVRAA